MRLFLEQGGSAIFYKNHQGELAGTLNFDGEDIAMEEVEGTGLLGLKLQLEVLMPSSGQNNQEAEASLMTDAWRDRVAVRRPRPGVNRLVKEL